MIDWINARNRRPVMFGKYFVKINSIKHIIDFHAFDFHLDRGEEVLWLEEPVISNGIKTKQWVEFESDKKIGIKIEEPILFDPVIHISLIKYQQSVFELRKTIAGLKEEIIELKKEKELIRLRNVRLNEELNKLKEVLVPTLEISTSPEVEIKATLSTKEY